MFYSFGGDRGVIGGRDGGRREEGRNGVADFETLLKAPLPYTTNTN